MRTILSILTFCLLINVNAQDKKQKDIKAIKSMTGCFDVKFNFAETFSYSKDSLYKASKIKQVGALELAYLINNDDDKIQIQHLLVIPMEKGEKPMIMKHWRQDWIFENNKLYEFDKDNQWNYIELPKDKVKGQWTQKVYQVDDSPRYEGTATWVHVDGKSYWENTTNAPLPRREYSQRFDYNVTLRRNRQEITNFGWIHDQDNDKIIRKENKKDILIAQEKGYNEYKRVSDEKCSAAVKWWNDNKDFWENTRISWDAIYNRKKNLKLRSKVDHKKLYKVLFRMDPKTTTKETIQKTIDKYIVE